MGFQPLSSAGLKHRDQDKGGSKAWGLPLRLPTPSTEWMLLQLDGCDNFIFPDQHNWARNVLHRVLFQFLISFIQFSLLSLCLLIDGFDFVTAPSSFQTVVCNSLPTILLCILSFFLLDIFIIYISNVIPFPGFPSSRTHLITSSLPLLL
jgi:hypothetical protein